VRGAALLELVVASALMLVIVAALSVAIGVGIRTSAMLSDRTIEARAMLRLLRCSVACAEEHLHDVEGYDECVVGCGA
jgi:uncharacterized metal-binding protein